MGGGDASGQGAVRSRNVYTVATTEELCWGDAGLFLAIPNAGLGGAAVTAAGTPEQKQRFLAPFRGGKPKWGAMAITEPGCGSDSAADHHHRDSRRRSLGASTAPRSSAPRAGWRRRNPKVSWWSGPRSTRTPAAPGSKPFVVEHGTPGMTVARVENKLGIRAQDTAAMVFDNCRVPARPSARQRRGRSSGGGFKDVMATFDATRPIVAAMAIGVGRAALDFVRDFLASRRSRSATASRRSRLSAVERDFMEMEVQLKAARLLTWRAAWMLDMGMRNSLEASMAKAKAGLAVTLITQKAVELLGPLGYSRSYLLEKWMRDAKINDIFEGTQQINLMIVARRILGYSSKELN